MPCADLSRRFMPAPPASHLPGSKISNSFLETLSTRKRKSLLRTNLLTFKHGAWILCKSAKHRRTAAAVVFMPAKSLRCGPCRAAFDGVKGKHFMRALISGDCHDRRVELPDRCDVHGATIVVKVFEGHPQNLDRQR